MHPTLEMKFAPSAPAVADTTVEGYAALFGVPDRGGDVIAPGAFERSLKTRQVGVKFLWQHEAGEPIGVWDDISEDGRGLKVRGRLLPAIRRGAEALALLEAGALDGLSIGFRTVRAEGAQAHRVLTEIELWEISLVTFPMAEGARLSAPLAEQDHMLVDAIRRAGEAFAL